MTVRELIDILQNEDPNRIVIMARDSEGNGYSPLRNFWIGAYQPDSTYSGEVGMERLTKEDEDDGYTEEDVIEGGQPALILTPTN